MSTTPIATEVQSPIRLKGFALASVIIALMLTLFLEALDQAIVGVAMPLIIAELQGMDRYSWVVTAYILASVTMIPIVGKLSDQFGRKWFLLAGTVLFLLGSLLSGAAQSMDQLILFRGVQGLGAGIGMALVATVMADLFPPAERAKWGGLFGGVYGLSSLLGPTIGGWLSEHGPVLGNLITEESRWRWIFYINVPLGLLAVLALLIFLPANASVRTNTWTGWKSLHRIDFLGAFLCSAATIILMLALTWGGEQIYAWISPQVLGMLTAGVVLFILFLSVERKAEEPILPLNLFRNQVFSVGALIGLLQMMVLLGLALYLPLFLQGVMAIAPTTVGLVFIPFNLSMVAGAILSGIAVNALKRYQIVAILSALLMSVGVFLIASMTPTTSVLQIIVFMVVTGIGTGVFFSLPMVAVQNALPASSLGVGTAAVRYLGQIGAVLGIAIVGTAVTSAGSGDLMSQMPTDAVSKAALAGALQYGFIAVLVFALIALIATFFLKDVPFVEVKANEDSETSEQQIEIESKELIHA